MCPIQVPQIHQCGIIAWIQFDCVFVEVHGRCIIPVLRFQSTDVVVDFRIIWTNAKCRSIQLFLVGPVTSTLIWFQHENHTNEHSKASGNLQNLIFMNSPTKIAFSHLAPLGIFHELDWIRSKRADNIQSMECIRFVLPSQNPNE